MEKEIAERNPADGWCLYPGRNLVVFLNHLDSCNFLSVWQKESCWAQIWRYIIKCRIDEKNEALVGYRWLESFFCLEWSQLFSEVMFTNNLIVFIRFELIEFCSTPFAQPWKGKSGTGLARVRGGRSGPVHTRLDLRFFYIFSSVEECYFS